MFASDLRLFRTKIDNPKFPSLKASPSKFVGFYPKLSVQIFIDNGIFFAAICMTILFTTSLLSLDVLVPIQHVPPSAYVV